MQLTSVLCAKLGGLRNSRPVSGLHSTFAEPASSFRAAQIMFQQHLQIGFVIHIHLQPRAPAEDHARTNAFRFANVFRKTPHAEMRREQRRRHPQNHFQKSAALPAESPSHFLPPWTSRAGSL